MDCIGAWLPQILLWWSRSSVTRFGDLLWHGEWNKDGCSWDPVESSDLPLNDPLNTNPADLHSLIKSSQIHAVAGWTHSVPGQTLQCQPEPSKTRSPQRVFLQALTLPSSLLETATEFCCWQLKCYRPLSSSCFEGV